MATRRRTVKRRAAPAATLAYRLDELEGRVDEVDEVDIAVSGLARRVDELEAAVEQLQRLAGLRR